MMITGDGRRCGDDVGQVEVDALGDGANPAHDHLEARPGAAPDVHQRGHAVEAAGVAVQQRLHEGLRHARHGPEHHLVGLPVLAVVGVGGDAGVGAREGLGAGGVQHGLVEARPRRHQRVLVVLQHVVGVGRARGARHQGPAHRRERESPRGGPVLREDAAGGEQAEEALQDGRVRVALREELGGGERGVGAAGPDGGGDAQADDGGERHRDGDHVGQLHHRQAGLGRRRRRRHLVRVRRRLGWKGVQRASKREAEGVARRR
jgi:hypothetical protein